MKRAWPVVLAPALVGVVLCPLVLLMPHWVRGFALGVSLSSGAWGSVLVLVSLSGVLPLYTGQLAEQQTAYELRRLRRRGWEVGNHVLLSSIHRSDIDHLAVGPGGALVVETKHMTSGWRDTFAEERLRDAVRTVKEKQALVAAVLQRQVPRPLVRAVVVIGGGTLATDPVRSSDGVNVVPLARLRSWLASEMGSAGVSTAAVSEAWAKVMARVAQKDKDELAVNGPAPRLVEEWLRLAAFVALVAMAGYLAEVYAVRATGAAWFMLVGAGFGASAYAARRAGLHSPWWQAWLAGSQVVTAIFAVAFLARWVLQLVG
jgi:hypothetical protein